MPIGLPRQVATNITSFTGRSWVVPEVFAWLERDDRVFLITGLPGAGKSMLAAWLAGFGPAPADSLKAAQLVQLRAAIKGAHFCIAGANVAPQDVIAGLGRRLTETVDGFGTALLTSNGREVQISISQQAGSVSGSMTGLAVERLVLGDITPERAVSLLLVDPLVQLYTGGYSGPLVLLVDSLDEAETASTGPKVAQLIAGLRNRPELPPQVRILATTRPDPRLLAYFKPLPAACRLDLIDDAPGDAEDIAQYALGRLAGLDAVHRAVLAQKVTTAARGIFLYAHLVLEDLRTRPSTPAEVETLELPQDLGDLYHQFLLREIGAEERWYSTYYSVLGLITVAEGNGLNREQIQRILGKPRHEVEPVLRACAQYLVGNVPDGPFRPFHQSFAEFLIDDERNIDRHIDAGEMHDLIAKHYLALGMQGWERMDVYGLRALPYHLAGAVRRADLRALLLNYDWLAAKLVQTGFAALLADYSLLDLDIDSELRLVRDALRLSSHILGQDATQLRAQLLGRLLMREEVSTRVMLEQVTYARVSEPWLRPLTASLAAERSARWLRPMQESVLDSVVFSPNGLWAAYVEGSFGPIPRFVVLLDLKEWQVYGPRFKTLDRLNPFALALSNDGRWCLYADSVGGVHRLDASGGGVWSGNAHRDLTIAKLLAISSDGRRALSADMHGKVVAWDIEAELHEDVYDESHVSIEALCLDSNGTSAVVAHADGSVDLLNLWPTRQRTLFKLKGQPSALARSFDNSTVAVASTDGSIEVHSVASIEVPICTLFTGDKPTAIALSYNSQYLAFGTENGKVEVWNIKSSTRSAEYNNAHTYKVEHIVFSHNGEHVISADSLHIKEWNCESSEEEEQSAVISHATGPVKVTADGTQAVAVLGDGRLGVWNISTGSLISIFPSAPGPSFGDSGIGSPKGLVLAANGTRVLAWNEKLLCVWDLGPNASAKSLSVEDTRDADITSDGNRVVYVNGLYVTQWKPGEGEVYVLGTYDGDTPGYVTISPDGQRVLTSGGSRSVFEWPLDPVQRPSLPDSLKHLFELPNYLNSWRPDSRDKPSCIKYVAPKKAIVTTGDGSLFMLRTDQERLIKFDSQHEAFVRRLLVTSDGRFAVTSSLDRRIMMWDLETFKRVAEFDAHPGNVEQLSKSGLRALLTTFDGVLKIISLRDGSLIAAFQSDRQIISCAADTELRWIVACDQGGQMHFLRLEDGT